jgi:uncharacterized membrane protein
MMENDHRMETQMGSLLRIGVAAACGVMMLGATLYLLRHGAERESFTTFHGEPAALESVVGVLRQARTGSARGIIQLSVLMMIATPVMRVAFAVHGFARRREWMFTGISLIVLGVLAFGLFQKA